MGLLKKIFKPVSKVLDKIIPNEIKPALPYLAAFAPYLGPMQGIMGTGMLQRALVSGGLNIGSQLAQEGNEGEINMLSAGLGALQGAMTAPNAASKFQSMKLGQVPVPEAQMMGSDAAFFNTAGMKPDMMMGKDLNMFQKAANYGLEGLAKGSEFIEKMQGSDKFVDKLKLYTAPATQATGDLMYAQGQRDLKDLAQDVVDDMGGGYTDDAYRAAIRKSMTAYGATEEEIVEAIIAAGYKSGGRVGLEWGGMPRALQAVEEKETEWVTKKPEWETVKRNLNEIFQQAGGLEGEGMNAVGSYVRDNNLNYEWILEGDEIKVKEKENMAEPVNILDSMDGINTFTVGDGIEIIMPKERAKGGRINKAEGGVPSVLPKGVEADYRGGGFIPIGSKERADDVPARLSENEFIMTADAVRAAGGGSVNQGAKRMYNLVHNLEARA